MRLTLLGSGNSAGMPLYGCNCDRCELVRSETSLRRGPASALIEFDNKKYLIDAGLMDLADRYPAGSLDGIFLTHFHADHVQGLFHLRWGKGDKIPVYCPPDSNGCDDLFKNPGILDFKSGRKFESFELGALKITPLPLIHSRVTFGYLFEYKNQRIAYLTDTKGLPENTALYLENISLDIMLIDTTFPPGSDSTGHNNLDDALQIHDQVNPGRTVLTHIGHDLDVWLSDNLTTLDKDVVVGSDHLNVFPYYIQDLI